VLSRRGSAKPAPSLCVPRERCLSPGGGEDVTLTLESA
jgi:hypothetical protein